MKKIAIGIVLLVLMVALAAPKLIGDRAHREYLQGFSEYPLGASGISYEHVSYEQSWFTSNAVTLIKVPLGGPEGKSFSVVLTTHIVHGPIVSTDQGIAWGLAYMKSNFTFADLSPAAQKLADQYLPAGTITIASLIDFKELSHDVMRVGSINFKNAKVSAAFGGLNVSAVSKPDYSLMKGKIALPASHLASDNMTVDIADASGSFDQYKHLDMMLGKADFNFPQIKFVGKQGAVTLDDFRMASGSEDQSGKLNVTGSIGIGKISAPVPVTAFQYNIEADQVDYKAIELWGEITRATQVHPADPATGLNNPQLRQLFELLLQKGMEVKQQFTLDSTSGRLNVDWDTHTVGLPDGMHIDGTTDRTQILKALDMHIIVSIDEKVLMATPFAGMVTPYMQRGMIAKQGGKLVADMKLSGGVLTVNGIPVPMKKPEIKRGSPRL